MSRRIASTIVIVLLAASGCASGSGGWSWPPWQPQSRGGAALALADDLAERGDYVQAVAAYDAYLTKYPDEPEAKRALQTRDALAAIVSLRQELGRLRDELAKLRTDLERLKQIDLGQERRR